MNGHPDKPVSAYRKGCALTIALILLVVFTSCSAPSKLKRKVALAGFTNQTKLHSTDLQQAFNTELLARISDECSHNILVKPNDLDAPSFLNELPRNGYGEIDHYMLSQASRQLGFNAVITGNFVAIRADEIKKGYLWFEKSQPVTLINISVEVYDTETAAKLLDQNFTEKVAVDEYEIDSIKQNKLTFSEVINHAVTRLADDIADEVCDAISDLPWKGFIVSVNNDRVALSAGDKTEIRIGDILEVYDSSQIIEGYNRYKFFLPGLKTGEVKVTAVFPDHTEAVVISGAAIKPGFTVMAK